MACVKIARQFKNMFCQKDNNFGNFFSGARWHASQEPASTQGGREEFRPVWGRPPGLNVIKTCIATIRRKLVHCAIAQKKLFLRVGFYAWPFKVRRVIGCIIYYT